MNVRGALLLGSALAIVIGAGIPAIAADEMRAPQTDASIALIDDMIDAIGVNERGQVLGYTVPGGSCCADKIAVLWDGQKSVRLMDGVPTPTFLGNDGTALILVETRRQSQSYLWNAGSRVEVSFRAEAIDSKGVIYGSVRAAKDSCVALASQGGRVSARSEARTIFQGDNCRVVDANGEGQVLVSTLSQTLLLKGETSVKVLGIEPRAMNNRGVIVGIMSGVRPIRPAVWENGVVRPLEGETGEAQDINDDGTVVGWAAKDGRNVAAVWTQDRLVFLDQLLKNRDPRILRFNAARSINNKGQIAGAAVVKDSPTYSNQVAFLATLPVGVQVPSIKK